MIVDTGYIGCDLSDDDHEIILAVRWDKKLVKVEPELFAKKFWSYRHLSVVKATYLFAHVFIEETRNIIRKHIDNTPPKVLESGAIKDWQPLKNGDIFDPPVDPARLPSWKRMINCLIRARQTADKFGIPYDFFIREGLRSWYFGRFYVFKEGEGGKGKRTLLSTDMLTNEDCLVAIAEKWIEELESRIIYSDHERYLVVNDVGHSDVREHQEYICKQIAKKANPVPALAKFLKLGFLSAETVRARFGVDRLAKAEQSLSV